MKIVILMTSPNCTLTGRMHSSKTPSKNKAEIGLIPKISMHEGATFIDVMPCIPLYFTCGTYCRSEGGTKIS